MKFGIVVLMFVLSFRPLIPLLDYGYNYDYISTILCINRDKPEMQCNGKCQLVKEIAQKSAEDSPDTNSTISLLKILDVFVVQEKFIFSSKRSGFARLHHSSFYINLYSYLAFSSILKPPAA